MKKLSLILMLMLMLVLAIVPVTAQDDMTDYDSIDPAALEGVTIDFWHQHTRFRAVQLSAIVAVFNDADVTLEDFLATEDSDLDESDLDRLGEIIDGLRDVSSELNPYGIVVNESNQGGYGDIFEKMTLGIVGGGGDLPQLVVAYQNQAATYQLDNALIDMTSLVTSEVWGLTEEEANDFFEGFYNADIFPTYDGARLGFPPNRSMEMMYYNIDWLAEMEANGVISFSGPPQTPDQFREAACAAVENPFSMTANPDVASMGYQLSINASRFASWTFGFGGDVFDYEAGMYNLNGAESVAAMEFLQGMFADGCAVEAGENFGDQTDFGQGTLLFTVGSSSGLPFYGFAVSGGYEGTGMDGFDWTVAPVPYVTENPRQNVYGASVSIPRSTPEQELASWIFLKYYTDTRVQAFWASASNYFPVRESVAAEMEDYFAANPAYGTAFDLLQYSVTEPPVPGYDPVRDDMENTMAFIVENTDEDVQDALDELNEDANEDLADLMEDLNG